MTSSTQIRTDEDGDISKSGKLKVMSREVDGELQHGKHKVTTKVASSGGGDSGGGGDSYTYSIPEATGTLPDTYSLPSIDIVATVNRDFTTTTNGVNILTPIIYTIDLYQTFVSQDGNLFDDIVISDIPTVFATYVSDTLSYSRSGSGNIATNIVTYHVTSDPSSPGQSWGDSTPYYIYILQSYKDGRQNYSKIEVQADSGSTTLYVRTGDFITTLTGVENPHQYIPTFWPNVRLDKDPGMQQIIEIVGTPTESEITIQPIFAYPHFEHFGKGLAISVASRDADFFAGTTNQGTWERLFIEHSAFLLSTLNFGAPDTPHKLTPSNLVPGGTDLVFDGTIYIYTLHVDLPYAYSFYDRGYSSGVAIDTKIYFSKTTVVIPS
jgi:hypothetical protein